MHNKRDVKLKQVNLLRFFSLNFFTMIFVFASQKNGVSTN